VAQVWECGDLRFDEGTQSVTRAGAPVTLTAIEFQLLGVLVRNRTRVVPKRPTPRPSVGIRRRRPPARGSHDLVAPQA